jgi:hypothetical protein
VLEFIDRFDELEFPTTPPHTARIGIAAAEFRVAFRRVCLRRALGVARASGPSPHLSVAAPSLDALVAETG